MYLKCNLLLIIFYNYRDHSEDMGIFLSFCECAAHDEINFVYWEIAWGSMSTDVRSILVHWRGL